MFVGPHENTSIRDLADYVGSPERTGLLLGIGKTQAYALVEGRAEASPELCNAANLMLSELKDKSDGACRKG